MNEFVNQKNQGSLPKIFFITNEFKQSGKIWQLKSKIIYQRIINDNCLHFNSEICMWIITWLIVNHFKINYYSMNNLCQ